MRDKLIAIRSTLQTLTIQSTEDNLSKLLGCIQALTALIEEKTNDD